MQEDEAVKSHIEFCPSLPVPSTSTESESNSGHILHWLYLIQSKFNYSFWIIFWFRGILKIISEFYCDSEKIRDHFTDGSEIILNQFQNLKILWNCPESVMIVTEPWVRVPITKIFNAHCNAKCAFRLHTNLMCQHQDSDSCFKTNNCAVFVVFFFMIRGDQTSARFSNVIDLINLQI